MGVKLSQTKAERNAEINKAIAHSETTHAPADAEKNVIVGIQKNGVDVAVGSNRKSNITVPTKLSELTNDKNFITASDNVATATKLKNARTIALSGGATGTATSFDGSANVTIPVTSINPKSISDGYTTRGFYLNTHPENNGVIIPFMNNDIAYLTKRGGSVVVKCDGVVKSVDVSNVFDGSSSFVYIGLPNISTITIELTLHRVFKWTNTFYIDFGSHSYRAKNIKLEVMNTNYAADVWTQKGIVTDNPYSEYKVELSHVPVGASNAAGGFNKVRITLSNWASSTSLRIAAIGIINYASLGLRETFLPKDGGSVYGGITPFTNNVFDLGSSSNKWANVYATKFTGALTGNAGTATKWATARNINGMTVDGTADRTNYGTCSTAADTAAKTVDCAGFELVTGAEITVKFTVDNAAASPTLNVNGTRARPIYYRGSPIATGYLAAGRVYTFRYDGARYELVGDVNTDSDTKVTQAVTTANAEYPLLLGPNGQTTNVTTTAYFDSGVTLNPSTNTIAANISGSAAKVAKALTVKANGTQLYTYDGSAAKTINIKAGSNITITSDSSGNITISSTASAGSVTGDVGEVLYEKTSGGLYCDGKTYATKDNSYEIQDPNPNGYYKRFRFYCQGYYGLVCVDMPLDREHPAYITTNGTRYGGVIFPTAENGNINNNTGIGPSSHMYYELKWRVTRDLPVWKVQVIDSGWLGLNAGKTTNADYAENASTSNAGTGYVSWNQRHNNTYCIYKIVGYKV